jgi:hypothetical protein
MKQGFHRRCQHIFEWQTKPHETVTLIWGIHVLFCMSTHTKVSKRKISCVAGKASWLPDQRFWMTELICSSQFCEVKEPTSASPVWVLMEVFICLLNYEDNQCVTIISAKSWLSIHFKWEPCISILWYSFRLTMRSAWLPMWSKGTTCPLHMLEAGLYIVDTCQIVDTYLLHIENADRAAWHFCKKLEKDKK